LAGDVDESVVIAEDHLEDASLLALYDDVVLPALRLAAADVARRGLSDERRTIVMRTALELVSDLADHEEDAREAPEEAQARAALEEQAPEARPADARAGAAASEMPAQEAEARPEVLCVAGRSGLDLAIAAIVGQLLERRGMHVRIVSSEALTPEHLPSCRID